MIGRSQLELWARGLERFTEARARHDPAQFIDVDYHDFVADPLGTVEGIYTTFGLPLTAAAQGAMEAMHEESHSGPRRPSHKYTLEEFGLTAAEVEERFGA